MKYDLSNIMTRAWMRAKYIAAHQGGKAYQYIGYALRLVWKKVKNEQRKIAKKIAEFSYENLELKHIPEWILVKNLGDAYLAVACELISMRVIRETEKAVLIEFLVEGGYFVKMWCPKSVINKAA